MARIELKNPAELADCLTAQNIRNVWIVRTRHETGTLNRIIAALEERKMRIAGMTCAAPNPQEVAIRRELCLFERSGAEAILAIGGGSVIDTAKCMRFWSERKDSILLYAVPTTAGSGSEATHFATVYRGEIKTSVTDKSLYPDAVLFDAAVLSRLAKEQKIAGMADAACHAIESLWAKKKTPESRDLAAQALRLVWKNRKQYLSGDPEAQENMMRAADLAGQAIDRSNTTAGHAMSYLLTSRYGMPHGIAAALCVRELMADLAARGLERESLLAIARAMGLESPVDAAEAFGNWIRDFQICVPKITIEEAGKLADGINRQRLENYPVSLDKDEITALYSRMCDLEE